MKLTMKDRREKTLLKQALTELIEERPQAFLDVLEEAFEDAAMIELIKEAQKNKKLVSRERIFERLRSNR